MDEVGEFIQAYVSVTFVLITSTELLK